MQGACDTHFHVFDQQRFAYAENRSYTPTDAPLAKYRALMLANGFTRAVLVHPSVFGADHFSLEQSLEENAAWLRGVAVVFPDTSQETLARWHRMGVRGTRANLLFAGGPNEADVLGIIEKIRSFGWHLQVLLDAVQSLPLLRAILATGVTLVVDHMGHHAPDKLLTSSAWPVLRDAMKSGQLWFKLSGPYRNAAFQGTADQPTYPVTQVLIEAMLEANPQQLVWGSDWPHPPAHFPIPQTSGLVGLIPTWLPDASIRHEVLVANPHRLYFSN